MVALDQVSERFSGAKVAYQMVNSVKDLLSRRTVSAPRENVAKRSRMPESITQGGTPQSAEDEADMLEVVAGMIDLTLAHNQAQSSAKL